jgi:hypothetical protein
VLEVAAKKSDQGQGEPAGEPDCGPGERCATAYAKQAKLMDYLYELQFGLRAAVGTPPRRTEENKSSRRCERAHQAPIAGWRKEVESVAAEGTSSCRVK